jgi:hypothetical protein
VLETHQKVAQQHLNQASQRRSITTPSPGSYSNPASICPFSPCSRRSHTPAPSNTWHNMKPPPGSSAFAPAAEVFLRKGPAGNTEQAAQVRFCFHPKCLPCSLSSSCSTAVWPCQDVSTVGRTIKSAGRCDWHCTSCKPLSRMISLFGALEISCCTLLLSWSLPVQQSCAAARGYPIQTCAATCYEESPCPYDSIHGGFSQGTWQQRTR